LARFVTRYCAMNHRGRAFRAFTFLTGLAIFGVAQRAGAEEPESTDNGRIRTGVVLAGGITFGVGYLGSLFIANESGSPYSEWGYVPIAGPVIMAERTQAHCDERSGGFDDNVNDFCDGVSVTWVLSAVSTVVQVAGGTMLAYGLLDRKKEQPGVSVAVAPVAIGRAGYGVAASGSF
jgi:hypothetical protein